MKAALLALALAILRIVTADAATWVIFPDGSGDAPTIQAGIDSAAVGDTVLVGCGTYHEHDIVLKGGVLLRSETGQPDCVTIEADSLGRVFYCENQDGAVTLEGLTIAEGWPQDSMESIKGGGAYCEGCSLIVTDCVFASNRMSVSHVGFARSLGAGLYCTSSSVVLTGCLFEDNLAHANSPDGMIGVGARGGGIYASSTDLVATNCSFLGNEVRAMGFGPDEDYPSVSAHGAALICSGGSVTLTDCDFHSNSASVTTSGILAMGSARGGAIFMSYCDSVAELSGCTFSSNLVEEFDDYIGSGGGAVYCYRSTPNITSCVFHENSAQYGGGAIKGEAAEVTLTSCTLAQNSAEMGAGIWGKTNAGVGSVITLNRTIISFSQIGAAVACTGSTALANCCDVYGNAGGDWVNCLVGEEGVSGNFAADPLFCDLETGDLTLAANSPCLPGNHPDGADCGVIGALGEGCEPAGVEDPNVLRTSLHLSRATPNPFATSTNIRYVVPHPLSGTWASLRVYDLAGRLIKTLVNAPSNGGIYDVTWDGRSNSGQPAAAGVYFYQLTAGGETQTGQAILLR
jgi:predicted outer membrane repeat protein